MDSITSGFAVDGLERELQTEFDSSMCMEGDEVLLAPEKWR